jgi:hypothetical protein
MLAGSVCFALVAAVFLVESDDRITTQRPLLFGLYVVIGVGRGVWESTMKAVFADFFGSSNSAFSEGQVIPPPHVTRMENTPPIFFS